MDMDVEALIRKNKDLAEELAQCKADKEFVWSLWKQLQTESPDVSGAVDMVITRERTKQEKRDKEIGFLLSEKDLKISSLQKALELSRQETVSVSAELKLSEGRCSSNMLQIVSMGQDLQAMQASQEEAIKASKKLKEDCEILNKSLTKEQEACKQMHLEVEYLEQQKQMLKEQMSVLSEKVKKLEDEANQSREATSNLLSTLSSSKEKCHTLQNEHSRICTKISQQEDEILKLREKLNECSQQVDCAESAVDPVVCGVSEENVVKMLEKTETELFEVKSELNNKTEELQCLRCTHDKRLERMKWLKANYNLVCEQLKTYDTQSVSDVKKVCRRRRHSESAIKHEDSKEVWNQLTKYKSLCQQLERDLMTLEEERDTLQAKCCRNQTTIAELRTCLQHEKEDLERKVAAIAVLEGSISSLSLQEEKFDELQCCLDKLEAEKNELLDRNSELEKQCAVFYQERISLESKIFRLEHELKMRRIKLLCKSTMTEGTPLKTPEEGLPQTSHELKVQSDSKHKTSVTVYHRRTHSEGDKKYCSKLVAAEVPQGRPIGRNVPLQKQASMAVKPSGVVQRKCMRSCSTQTDSKVAGVHKCAAQEKVKRLEQRLQVTLKKLSSEVVARKSLIQSLKDQSAVSEKHKEENRELKQKLQGYKVSLKAFENGKAQAEESVKKLQDRIWHLELSSTKCIEVPLKIIEKERKELQEKCIELRSINQSLQQELLDKDSSMAQAKKMQEKMERDLKQKRLLIVDYQRKLKEAEESESAKDITITSLSERLDVAVNQVTQNKQKNELLRAQMAQQTTDKEKLVSLLEKCQLELDGTIQEMYSNKEFGEKKVQAATRAIHSLSCDLESANHQISSLEYQLKESSEAVTEFKLVIKTLADELEVQQSKKSNLQSGADTTKTNLTSRSVRMRKIAHAALKLSDDEIDDFLMDSKSTHTVEGCYSPSVDSLFSKISKITRNFQPPFQRSVTSELLALFT